MIRLFIWFQMGNPIKYGYTLIRSTIIVKVIDNNNYEEHFFIDLQ